MNARTRTMRTAVAFLALTVALTAGCTQTRRPSVVEPVASAPTSSATTPTASPETSTPPAPSTPTTDAEGNSIGAVVTPSAGKKAPKALAGVSDATIIAGTKKVLAANEGVTIVSAKVIGKTADPKGLAWVMLDVTSSDGVKAKAVVTYNGKTFQEVIYGQTINTGDLPPYVKF